MSTIVGNVAESHLNEGGHVFEVTQEELKSSCRLAEQFTTYHLILIFPALPSIYEHTSNFAYDLGTVSCIYLSGFMQIHATNHELKLFG